MAPKNAQMLKRPAAQVLKRPSGSKRPCRSPSGSVSHGSDRVVAAAPHLRVAPAVPETMPDHVDDEQVTIFLSSPAWHLTLDPNPFPPLTLQCHVAGPRPVPLASRSWHAHAHSQNHAEPSENRIELITSLANEFYFPIS